MQYGHECVTDGQHGHRCRGASHGHGALRVFACGRAPSGWDELLRTRLDHVMAMYRGVGKENNVAKHGGTKKVGVLTGTRSRLTSSFCARTSSTMGSRWSGWRHGSLGMSCGTKEEQRNKGQRGVKAAVVKGREEPNNKKERDSRAARTSSSPLAAGGKSESMAPFHRPRGVLDQGKGVGVSEGR